MKKTFRSTFRSNALVFTAFAFLALLAFFALLASPVDAATAQETALHYANPGETVGVVNFTSNGARYHMVKLNGGESVILKEDKENAFAAVESETEISALVSEYLQQQFDAIGFTARSTAIVSNYDVYAVESERCVEAAKKLIRMSKSTPPYVYITINAGRDFPKEYAAILKLNATLPAFENAVNGTRNAVVDVERIVSGRNADKAVQILNEINVQATAFKTAYVNVSQARADIIATFPNAFLLQVDLKSHCLLDSNQTSAVDAVISQSSLGAIRSSSQLAKQITSVTAARGPGARKSTLNAEQTKQINEIADSIANVTQAYDDATRAAGAAPINLTVLWKQYAELQTLHAQLNNASANNTEAAAAAFNRKASETKEKIAFFESTREEYAKSLLAVDNATRQVDKIAKKYGSNDDRVTSLQKDLRALQILSKSYNDLLRDGMTSGVSFQAVTANATVISARAASLPPKENQLDLVLVGGAVILIGAVIGAFYYLRKKKSEGVAIIPQAQQPSQPAVRPPY